MHSNNFFGLYRGICVDNQDPDNAKRIRLKVPQVLSTNVSNWAYPCLPVTSNADHPDHLPHLASEVAALLNTHTTHSATITSGSGGSPSHTHSVVVSLAHNAHSGNSNELTHLHEDSVDPLEVNGTEHTPHRKIPNLNQGVWVMFEGGDPNFPVWIGVY
jgi:hypothetical protein